MCDAWMRVCICRVHLAFFDEYFMRGCGVTFCGKTVTFSKESTGGKLAQGDYNNEPQPTNPSVASYLLSLDSFGISWFFPTVCCAIFLKCLTKYLNLSIKVGSQLKISKRLLGSLHLPPR